MVCAKILCICFSILCAVSRSAATGLVNGEIQNAITLTDNNIAEFLDLHNNIRRHVTPAASNMRKMTWDNELANLALGHTRKCLFENNANTTHTRFQSIGEILYLSQNSAFDDNYIGSVVRSFARGSTQYNVTTQQCSEDNGDCSKYAQLVRAETFKIGCGITHCSTANSLEEVLQNAIIVVCNYAPSGNWKSGPAYEVGKACSGCHDTDSCEKKLCINAARDVDPPPAGVWEPWGEWTPCSVSCGIGTKRRHRLCSTFVSTDCQGSPSQLSLFCAPTRVCPKPQQTTAPPVAGEWLAWGTWSTCSKSCGGGKRTRSRDCDTGDNRDCVVPASQLSICNAQRCPSRTRVPYAIWDEWSECTRSCGGGVRYRTRGCPSSNPNECCGNSHIRRECNTRPCPRAVWSKWGRWYDAGDACTSDTQIRTRKCSTGKSEDCCVAEP